MAAENRIPLRARLYLWLSNLVLKSARATIRARLAPSAVLIVALKAANQLSRCGMSAWQGQKRPPRRSPKLRKRSVRG